MKMKRISSMLALGMALALTFGMTVNAAGSTTTQNPDYQPTQEELNTAQGVIDSLTDVTNVTAILSGTEVIVETDEIQAETVAELMSETVDVRGEAVNNMAADDLADVKSLLETAKGETIDFSKNEITVDPAPIAAVDIKLETETDLSSGLRVTISIPGFTPDEGEVYVIMHLGKNGWEVIIPDEVTDGEVTATFYDLSPATVSKLVLVPITETPNPVPPTTNQTTKPAENGALNETGDDGSDDDQATPAAANPAISPRTAETLPAAGIVALICLAGAAVCAGKIRYNK